MEELASRVAIVAKRSDHNLRQDRGMAGETRERATRPTVMAAKRESNGALYVAAVLHRRLPYLFQDRAMEWSFEQHGPGAWHSLVSRSQARIDFTEPFQWHGGRADH